MDISRAESSIKIDQSSYIFEVLDRFGMKDCNLSKTPLDNNQKLAADMSQKTEEERTKIAKVPYMQAIDCLLFAGQQSLPDIAY